MKQFLLYKEEALSTEINCSGLVTAFPHKTGGMCLGEQVQMSSGM